MTTLTLVSHNLCPYVQRAAIALSEKRIPFERRDIDLAKKPEWFKRISPLGKVPLLQVKSGSTQEPIFESAVILEYIEETQPDPLHPASPLERARHRSWMEFGSSVLTNISAFYNATTEADLEREAAKLSEKFQRLERELGGGPWFAGKRFSLVDCVFGPIFRYFDTFDAIDNFGIMTETPRVARWRNALAARPSIRDAVTPDYPACLRTFIENRSSALSRRVAKLV